MKKPFSLFMLGYISSLAALPSGGETIKGDAAISFSHPSELSVQASGNTILQWDQFDIASHELVCFTQTEIQSAILNRVTGDSASSILGRLQANCPIYLINAKGVFIGSSAQIETAGFLASTADLFWSEGQLSFEHLGDGAIVNLGTIRSSQGNVTLIARAVDNQGSINAPCGHVRIATTEAVIHPDSKQSFFIRLSEQAEAEEGIDNSGAIEALSVSLETLSPCAQAIRHTGSMTALSAVQQNNRIYLVAKRGGCLVDAALTAPAGSIQIEAQNVHVKEGALLDVNAKAAGNGGLIALFADQELIFHGLAQARGGQQSGDGGFIHLSSGGRFQLADQHPIVDAAASCGKAGRVLFDPQYVSILPAGSDPATGNTFASNPTGSVVISGSTLQAALDAANVTIQANTDIAFQDTVTATTAGNGLTLQAGRSILFNGGQLALNAADFNAVINDSGALLADRDSGVAAFQMRGSSQILTQGGDISVDVGTFGGSQEGEFNISGATLDAGGGDIAIKGFARQDGSDNAYGIYLADQSLIQTSGSGAISLSGQGGNGSNRNIGIYLSTATSQLQTEDGAIRLTGTGGGDSTGIGGIGIALQGTINSTGSGPITLNGFGGAGVHGNMGVFLNGAGQINVVDGAVTLSGVGSGTGALNFGIRFEAGAQCISVGLGTITLSGTSGTGKNNNHGVILSGGLIQANSGAVSITGIGQGSQNYNYGIRFETNSQCISRGTAPISLQGQGNGSTGCIGVSISTQGQAITSGYGDIQVNGTSNGTADLNQGVRVEMGQIVSTGVNSIAADIHLTGVGGMGTDHCNGVVVSGDQSVITSVDGNIVLEGTAPGSGSNNQPIVVESSAQVDTTGTGTVTYIDH